MDKATLPYGKDLVHNSLELVMDKKFAIQFVFLIIAIFVGLFSVFQPQLLGLPSIIPGGGNPFNMNTAPNTALSVQSLLIIDAASTGNPELVKSVLTVDVADTPEKRSQGLSDKENMDFDRGMLFVFEQEVKPNFIMRNMRFSLDFIWVKNDFVVDILENIPPDPAGTPEESLKRYAPIASVDKVIEVSAGYVKKYGIKVGDRIKIDSIETSGSSTTY
jgi:uncharacterized membrane protein (UPF0127 family)